MDIKRTCLISNEELPASSLSLLMVTHVKERHLYGLDVLDSFLEILEGLLKIKTKPRSITVIG